MNKKNILEDCTHSKRCDFLFLFSNFLSVCINDKYNYINNMYAVATKGQLISKANCQAENSSKKRTNEFVFTTMRRVF